MKQERRRHPAGIRCAGGVLLALALAAGSLTGCGRGGDLPVIDNGTGGGTGEDVSLPDGSLVTPDTVPDADPAAEAKSGTYDASSVTATVTLTGGGADISGRGVSVSGSAVTFTAAGTYLITGSLTDGQLIVNTADTENVKLVLNGVSVACSTGPAVLVLSSPKKTILYTAAESVNLLSDGTGYVVADDQQTEGEIYPNACVYACDDLKLDGEGTLQITANADKGVNTKDGLEITGGILTVTAPGTAVRGNDSVEMTGGTVTLTVTGEGDGLKSSQTEKDGKGWVSVSGGNLYITAIGDGISAATDLTVSGGTLVINTLDAGGTALTESDSGSTQSNSGGFGWFGGFGNMGGGDGNRNKSSISAKGLKAEDTVTVTGGKLTVTAADDGIHSNDTVLLEGGAAYIRSADDGVHADRILILSGGSFEIAQSYEGLEAAQVTISGGTTCITASDDGINASNGSGNAGGGFDGGGRPGGGGNGGGFDGGGRPGGGGNGGGFNGGGRPGGNGGNPGGGGNGGGTPPDGNPGEIPTGTPGELPDGQQPADGSADGMTDGTATDTLTPLLTVSGGCTVVYASGDGIDSNGNIVMTGGTLLVFGPTSNGDGAIDYGDGNCSMTISGGTLLAVGSSGMAETATGNGQAVFDGSFRSSIAAGTLVGLCDADGNLICGYRLPKVISSIVFSSSALTSGATYTLVQGGTAEADANGVLDMSTWTGYSTFGSMTAK